MAEKCNLINVVQQTFLRDRHGTVHERKVVVEGDKSILNQMGYVLKVTFRKL